MPVLVGLDAVGPWDGHELRDLLSPQNSWRVWSLDALRTNYRCLRALRNHDHAPFAHLVNGPGPGVNRVHRPRRPTCGLLLVLKDLCMDFNWAVRAFHQLLQKTPLLLRKLVRISTAY